MKVSIVDKANVTETFTITDASVLKAAKRMGYQELIQNPNAQRALEKKQGEILLLEPTDPQRAILKEDLRKLQEDANKPISNPQTAEAFLSERIQEFLIGGLIDEASIQDEANKLAQKQLADQRKAARLEMGMKPK